MLALALPAMAQAGAQGKKALLIVASTDFSATEYSKTRSALESGGMTCTVASTKVGTLKSDSSKRAKSEMMLGAVKTADYDAIVIIGGNGIKKMWRNSEAHRIAREATDQGKVVAAICAGPAILAYAGVMKGKKGTAHSRSGARSVLKNNGCDYTGSRVEVDGKLITANGPKASSQFGKAIVAAFN